MSITLMFGFFALQTKTAAMAEAEPPQQSEEDQPPQTIDPVSDNFFSLGLQTTPRENQSVSYEKRDITDTAGVKRTYLCLKWCEVEVLKFVINFENSNPMLRFNYYSLTETFTTTDDMQTPLAPMPSGEMMGPTPLISNKAIDSNSIINYTFNYFVDSKYEIPKTDTSCAGKDFGLYKFELSYNYTITTSADQTGESTDRHIEMYIAVLPTEITEELEYQISKTDLKILYRVTNERLMNKFVLWLSNSEILAYINPRYIKWKVTGRDGKNFQYVLDDNQRGESGEKTVYDASPWPPYGTEFEFDSRGIEGTWNITCQIEDRDGNVIYTQQVKNLSTFRVEKESNLWWILLIVFGSLIVILAAILVIYFVRRNREHIW